MSEWKAKILDFYYGLGERDRKVVNWGAPVILLLVLYLLVGRPLLNSYLQVASTHSNLRSDVLWLVDQQQHLQRVNSYCSAAIEPVGEADFEFVVTGQARRLGLEPIYRRGGQEQVLNFEIRNAAGNAILTLTRELACRGMALDRLEMTANESARGMVDARLELRPL